ncbi:MAG TPA: TonB-dependent receptor [Ignavibacteriales bacterium]|nr:TonB-dependent receptor [Ignavibacteriales bacterium]
MKKILVLFFVLFIASSSFAQNFTVKGQIAGSVDKNPLTGATVMIIHLPDSTVQGAISGEKGKFLIEKVKPGRYLINVTYLGFMRYEDKLMVRGKSAEVGTILLTPESVKTGEIEIIGKMPPVVQKSDTAEFNAGAFKTNPNATAEDLVTKMPGMIVQDGKVQTQGEDVKRVLVDGKPFFGDDPSAVLRNIPADAVDKVQVFDQQSDQAQFTGFDDGNTTKTLNVVTRLRVREGTFGRLLAGYGDASKYQSGGNINFFNDDRRISLLGLVNNVNQQNFSNEDLLGVMQGSGGGGHGGRGGGGGGPRGNWGGGSAQNFMVNSQNGITTTKAFGLNYSDKWGDKLELSGSYFFNQSDNDAQSDIRRNYFVGGSAGQNYFENGLSNSGNTNHRLSMKLDYQIDSLNSITFRPRLSIQKNDQTSGTSGRTDAAMQTLSAMTNNAGSNLSALNSSGDLLFRHRFETPGRTLSLGLSGNYKKNSGGSRLFSENIYYYKMIDSDTLDQISDADKNGRSGSANIVYTEPFLEYTQLQFTSRTSYSEDESDQRTFKNVFGLSDYSYQDTSLSNVYKKQYTTQAFGAGFRYQKEALSFMINVNYNIAHLKNDQTFPHDLVLNRPFYSVLPFMMMRYNISRDKNLRVFYRSSNDDPSVEQLQDVVDNSNPLFLSTGNPDLKQDNSHMLAVRYSQIDFKNLTSFFIMMAGTVTQDYIGNSSFMAYRDTVLNGIALKRGSQLSRPENMDGYMNFRMFSTFGLPVYFLKSNMNISLMASYSRTPGIINGTKSFSNATVLGPGFTLASNVGENLDFTISSRSSINLVKTTLRENANDNYFSQNSNMKFYWMFWKGFLFETNFQHRYDGGLPEGYDKNSYLLNLSVGKRFFSNDQGELRLTVNDVLNKSNSLQRTVTDSYYEDSRTNVLGRYLILTFTYNLKAF